MTDDEILAKIIEDSLRAEKYFENDEAEAEEASRGLDRAELAAEKLNDKIWKLRGRLDSIVAPLTVCKWVMVRIRGSKASA